MICLQQPIGYGRESKFEIPAIKCDEKYMVNLKVSPVKEEFRTEPDESDLIDLDALIQTYKDQCGMELAKKLIKQGLADPADFADDGKHSYDGSVIPETAQDRANAAVVAQKNLDAVKAAYGIDPNADMTDEQFEALIKDYISNHIDKFVKPNPITTEGGDK